MLHVKVGYLHATFGVSINVCHKNLLIYFAQSLLKTVI